MKNFYQMMQLMESVTVRIKDATYDKYQEDLGGLSYHLMLKLQPIYDKMTPEQKEFWKKNQLPEFIAPDGDDFFKRKGTLNFYLKQIPPELLDKFKKAVLYHIQDAGATIYKPHFINKSKLFDVDTMRIPVEMPKQMNPPPELNMSNENARLIFQDVLGFKQDPFQDEISARELLFRIDNYDENEAELHARPTTQYKTNFFDLGITGDQIRERLAKLREIAVWAIENDYDTINWN